MTATTVFLDIDGVLHPESARGFEYVDAGGERRQRVLDDLERHGVKRFAAQVRRPQFLRGE